MSDVGYYIVVTPFFPTETCFRGPFIYDQVQSIRKTGVYRDVFVFRPGTLKQHGQSYEYRGVRVHYYGSVNPPSLLFNGCTNGINTRLFINACKRAGIHADEVSVVHAHTSTLGACAVALKQQNPAITTLLQHHDPDPYTIRNGKWASWGVNTRYRARKNATLFNQIDVHICISRFVERHLLEFPHINPADFYDSYRQRLEKVGNLIPPHIKQSIILHNGVNTTLFTPGQTRRSSEHFTIGCIGNFVDWKSQITLLNAVSLLRQSTPHLRVRLVGSGPTLTECKEFVRSHGLESIVSFEEEVQHHELAAFYHSLDLFVLPSYFEGFGCVYLEAAACGVPFMACEGQGIEDYIRPDERHLWLCPPNDAEQLASMLKHYIAHRPQQTLAYSLDIDTLVNHLVTNLQKGGAT